jgi:hypothetical protein
LKKFGFSVAAVMLAALPAFASGIDYVCDGSIATNVCTTLNTTISGQYATIFSNANAYIYIESASSPDVASNLQVYNTVSYSAYYSALAANESGASDVTAVASLGSSTTNPVIAGQGVALTSALDAALGFSAQSYGITASGGICNSIGSASNANGCYNDVITVSNSLSFYYDGITAGSQTGGEYDFFSAVEHETNEALGTSSCLANQSGGNGAEGAGCNNGPNPDNPGEPCYGSGPPFGDSCTFYNSQGVSAADLFRYASNGVRSYSTYDGTTNGSLAYFSINHGATDIVPYNNSSNGADYGDWATSCTYVQDAYGCPGSGAGQNITNDGGVEIAALDAVGFNLTTEGQELSADTAAPEPGTIGMFASGFAVLALLHWRRRRAISTSADEALVGPADLAG